MTDNILGIETAAVALGTRYIGDPGIVFNGFLARILVWRTDGSSWY